MDFEELKRKLGYKVYKPRIGSLGRALIKAANDGNHRSVGWLKHQLENLKHKEHRVDRVQK